MGGNIKKYDNTVNNSRLSQILEDFYNGGTQYREDTGYSYDPKDLIGRTGESIRRDMLSKDDDSNLLYNAFIDDADPLIMALVKAWGEDHPGEVLSGTQFNKLALMGYNAYSQVRDKKNIVSGTARLFGGNPHRDNITQGVGFKDLLNAYKNDPAKVKYYFDQNKDLGFDPNMSLYENIAYNGGKNFSDIDGYLDYVSSSIDDKDNLNKKLNDMVATINYDDNFQESWDLAQQAQQQQKAIEEEQAKKVAEQTSQKEPYVWGSGISLLGQSIDPEFEKGWRGGEWKDYEW